MKSSLIARLRTEFSDVVRRQLQLREFRALDRSRIGVVARDALTRRTPVSPSFLVLRRGGSASTGKIQPTLFSRKSKFIRSRPHLPYRFPKHWRSSGEKYRFCIIIFRLVSFPTFNRREELNESDIVIRHIILEHYDNYSLQLPLDYSV